MQIEIERLALQLENPFTLSYGTSTLRENVVVRISDGHYTGLGEAAVVPYYHETPERVIRYATDPATLAALWPVGVRTTLLMCPSPSLFVVIPLLCLKSVWMIRRS